MTGYEFTRALGGARISDEEFMQYARCTPRTLARYKKDGPSESAAVRTRILAGFMPWPGFEEFEVIRGSIMIPGFKYGVTADDLRKLWAVHNENCALRRQAGEPQQFCMCQMMRRPAANDG